MRDYVKFGALRLFSSFESCFVFRYLQYFEFRKLLVAARGRAKCSVVPNAFINKSPSLVTLSIPHANLW